MFTRLYTHPKRIYCGNVNINQRTVWDIARYAVPSMAITLTFGETIGSISRGKWSRIAWKANAHLSPPLCPLLYLCIYSISSPFSFFCFCRRVAVSMSLSVNMSMCLSLPRSLWRPPENKVNTLRHDVGMFDDSNGPWTCRSARSVNEADIEPIRWHSWLRLGWQGNTLDTFNVQRGWGLVQ